MVLPPVYRARVISNVLNDIRRQHKIETFVREGHRTDVALTHGAKALLLAKLDSFFLDFGTRSFSSRFTLNNCNRFCLHLYSDVGETVTQATP